MGLPERIAYQRHVDEYGPHSGLDHVERERLWDALSRHDRVLLAIARLDEETVAEVDHYLQPESLIARGLSPEHVATVRARMIAEPSWRAELVAELVAELATASRTTPAARARTIARLPRAARLVAQAEADRKARAEMGIFGPDDYNRYCACGKAEDHDGDCDRCRCGQLLYHSNRCAPTA